MTADSTRYRQEVEAIGLSRTHEQTMAWITPGARVLELGCASGYIGRLLREQKGCRVTGVEFDRGAAEEARGNGLEVIQGSLEDAAFRASLPTGFDFVLASDVLEHLREPAPVLDDFKRWLAPNGRAIIAVPNIATWSMRSQLFFKGDFEYQETGILDRTHVHFFTWITLHKLVESQGWSVLDTMVEEWDLPVVRDTLVIFPRTLRRLAGKSKSAALDSAANGLQAIAGSLAQKIYDRFPNASANHVALLLEPPRR